MGEISDVTQIGISSIQVSLKLLNRKKVIRKTKINEIAHYYADDPQMLSGWMEQIVNQFQQYKSTVDLFSENLEISKDIRTSKFKFYSGYDGIRASYRNLFRMCEKNIIYSVDSYLDNMPEELEIFFKQKLKTLAQKTDIKMNKMAVEKERHTMQNILGQKAKIIPHKYFPILNSEINIAQEHIHFMSFDEKSGFAVILKDRKMAELLRLLFTMAWKSSINKERPLDFYMTDQELELRSSIQTRSNMFASDLKEAWRAADAEITEFENGEKILKIMEHEVAMGYTKPYIEKLTEIAAKNGGDILSVGYGLGFIHQKIEKMRDINDIQSHSVIELNQQIAKHARKNKELKVFEGYWENIIKNMKGQQFDGIIYNGYPLVEEEMHRDGISFIKQVAERNILKPDGILTFYVDATDKLGDKFLDFLDQLGFECLEVQKVKVKPSEEVSYQWKTSHFLAPTVKYKKQLAI